MKKFAMISLGCPRNLVDSEVIAGYLSAHGYRPASPEGRVDAIIVNTCAFVESAREESVEAIIGAGELKAKGKAKHLVICGCLGQMYNKKLSAELPEADLIIGTSDLAKIGELLDGISARSDRVAVSKRLDYIYSEDSPRVRSTPRHYSYVKISEGCSNSCSYCIISSLRGEYRSRPVESIIKEVRNISRSGKVKELILIGQDTTLFGTDRYGRRELPGLLSAISSLDNSVEWIRLLYTHPAHYSDELIGVIAESEKICKYLDLPIQHISDNVLKSMNRKTTRKEISKLICELRKRIPGLVLRTSVIVGFPGERDKDFCELLDFLKEIRFDRLGAFTYSRERGAPAARFKDQVNDDLKRERYNEVMKLQEAISAQAKKSFIGKTVDVLIDEKSDKGFVGRAQGDAPEIDGVVYIVAGNARVGDMRRVKITDTLEYDLIGELKS